MASGKLTVKMMRVAAKKKMQKLRAMRKAKKHHKHHALAEKETEKKPLKHHKKATSKDGKKKMRYFRRKHHKNGDHKPTHAVWADKSKQKHAEKVVPAKEHVAAKTDKS